MGRPLAEGERRTIRWKNENRRGDTESRPCPDPRGREGTSTHWGHMIAQQPRERGHTVVPNRRPENRGQTAAGGKGYGGYRRGCRWMPVLEGS